MTSLWQPSVRKLHTIARDTLYTNWIYDLFLEVTSFVDSSPPFVLHHQLLGNYPYFLKIMKLITISIDYLI